MNAMTEISDALLEEYRFINVDLDDWYDPVYQDFIEDMSKVGIKVDHIYFSGFGLQGDGACFEGQVEDWERFLKSLGYDSPVLIEFAQDYWAFSVKHNGHYCHEYCVDFNIDIPLPGVSNKDGFIYEFSPYPEGDLRTHVWYAILKTFDSDKLRDGFVETFRSYMRTLYKQLEEMYGYLISDEAVAETIIANTLQVVKMEV